MRLYNLYIVPGAKRELNLTARTRDEVVRDFHAGNLTLESLRYVRKEVFDMMFFNGLPQYLHIRKEQGGSTGFGA
jgi:hypothetical protein